MKRRMMCSRMAASLALMGTMALLIPATALGADAGVGLKDVLIAGVPHVQQRPDLCGEACVAMWMQKLGRNSTQDDVFELSGLDPRQGRGCFTAELARVIKKIGFDYGEVWQKVAAASADKEMAEQFRAVHEDLLHGVPSIVCMHFDDSPRTTEHFRLVLGYDAKTDEVIYHEPAVAAGAYLRMKRQRFLALWPLKYTPDSWTLIRFRLAAADPAKLVLPRATTGPTSAAFMQHLQELKSRTPRGFSTVLSRPFVVLGDEDSDTVNTRASETVAWAVKKLKAEYFTKDPDEIIDIWLFKDKDSYEKYARELFGDAPTTPFGYYSAKDRALIMNIATGGGTLVHEIVHPFVRANFPECPAWFNEGLGSLYEQSADHDGHIWGLTNWRLAGLQQALRAGTVPSFETFTATSDQQFYREDRGSNYGQARYLCLYLQEKGLLKKFYQEFTARHADDPTGYATLKKVLGAADMDKFKKEWEAWVQGLKFP